MYGLLLSQNHSRYAAIPVYLFQDCGNAPSCDALENRGNWSKKKSHGISADPPYLDPAVANDPGVYPPPETMAKLFPNLARSQEFTRELNRTWTRFMTGK